MNKNELAEVRELKMFGCYKKDIDEVADFYTMGGKSKNYGRLMAAMSILSDAQATISLGNTENGRLFINKAKYLIDSAMRSEDDKP